MEARSTNGLNIRRRYRWTLIPWDQDHAIKTALSSRTRQERVVVTLASGAPERLGTFDVAFARNLRDRLRYELLQRQPHRR